MAAQTQSPLNNAPEIIERFGGIRPMASKIGAAVTTVQGWKKRGSIPANRVNSLLEAALEHDIDITDLVPLPEIVANDQEPKGAAQKDEIVIKDIQIDNTKMSDTTKEADKTGDDAGEKAEDTSTAPQKPAPAESKPAGAKPTEAKPEEAAENLSNHSAETSTHYDDIAPSLVASLLHDDLITMIHESEKRAVMKSTVTNSILIIIALGAGLLLLWPRGPASGPSKAEREAEMARVEAIESDLNRVKDDVESMKDRQGFFGQVIPDDLNEKLASIQQQAAQAQAGAQNVLNDVQSLSDSVAKGDLKALEGRIQGLEVKLETLGHVPMMAALSDRYTALTSNAGGQDLLKRSTTQLSTLVSGLQGQSEAEISAAIDKARQSNAALGQSLEGVPADDLKAAALLMTMTQVRSSLNRSGEPFGDDLTLLKNLVGEDNPELVASINRLAPHAAEGILTPGGLSDELKSITGEVVVASLKGEDVSIKEKAQARLNSIFKLEKDGELVTGTPTQAKLQETQRLLDNGDLEGAIALMQTLDGDAAQTAAPWLDQAQTTLLAQQMQAKLSQTMAVKTGGYTASGKPSGAQLIHDPASGTMILKR